MRRIWIILFGLFVLGLAVGPSLLSRTPAADEELAVISPHWDGIRDEFGRAFEEHYYKSTGRRVHVVWLEVGGTGEIKKYLRERFAQTPPEKGIGADILFGGGMDMLPGMARDNYFEPFTLSPDDKKDLPAEANGQALRDAPKTPAKDDQPSSHLYHAACLSGFGFVYNKLVLKNAKLPTPATWDDLGAPAMRGWVSCGNPASSGAVHQAFELVLQGEGFEKGYATLARMMSNVRALNEGGSSIPRDVSLGQAAAGPCIDFYASAPIRRQGATHLQLVIPKGMGVATPDCIAVLRTPPNPAAAHAFLRYVLSEEGQRLWYQARGTPGGPVEYDLERLPVRPSTYKLDAKTFTVGNPFTDKIDFVYDGRKTGTRWEAMNDIWSSIIIDAHGDLFEARGAAIKAGRDGDLGQALVRPPFDEKTLLALCRGDAAKSRPAYKDLPADAKNALRNRWTKWARKWYAAVEHAAQTNGPVPDFEPAPTE